MTLGAKRRRFSKMIVILTQYIELMGYGWCFDKEHSKHHPKSLHFEGLAKDILIFNHNGYLKKTEEYEFAGLFWEFIGGTWGGRFDDGNHFSLAHGGMK